MTEKKEGPKKEQTTSNRAEELKESYDRFFTPIQRPPARRPQKVIIETSTTYGAYEDPI